MAKIAMIGAGSLIFCKTLVTDILATDALKGSELCLMSPTQSKLDRMEAFIQRMIRDNGLPATVWSTTDRREALKSARYVIVMVQVGGIDAFRQDYEIPLKYGVDQCIGDSLGPGGIFRGLRTIPVLGEIVRDMATLCPGALLLNYANPMAACCLALGRMSDRPFIGLCHGVQTTLDLIGRYVEVPKDRIDFLCAGINHMAWFLSLKHRRRCFLSAGGMVRECVIDRNYASGAGGAYLNYGGYMQNCLIYSNRTATYSSTCVAGGIYARFNNGTNQGILSCTIANNYAYGAGGGIYYKDYIGAGGLDFITNCIIYGNTSGSSQHEIANDTTTNLSYCCLSSTNNIQGPGNIAADPQFINPPTDYRLAKTSVCVNAGNNMNWMNGATDLQGFPRLDHYSRRVDIGAYEYLPSGTMFTGR